MNRGGSSDVAQTPSNTAMMLTSRQTGHADCIRNRHAQFAASAAYLPR